MCEIFRYPFQIFLKAFICNFIDYTYFPNLDVSYKFHEDSQSWVKAKSTCRFENANLAMPQNEEEIKVLNLVFDKHRASEFKYLKYHDYAFLGFHDIYEEGKFVSEIGKLLFKRFLSMVQLK